MSFMMKKITLLAETQLSTISKDATTAEFFLAPLLL